MNNEEEMTIVNECLKDIDAFKIIFDRYKNLVNLIIKRMMGDKKDSEDLLQDAFLLIWKSLKKFRGECSLKTYINKIVVNMCLNKIKKQNTEFVELKEDITINPDNLLESYELKRNIQCILSSLKPDYRVLIILREIQGLTYSEISKILNWSIPKVKVNLHRARRIFKEKYKEEMKDELRKSK